MALIVTLEQEASGAWRATVPSIPEVVGGGASKDEARDDARRKAALWLTENATVSQKHGFYFVHCESLDVSNQGETLQEAKDGLEETLFFFLSDDD
jgi:predicted RNase H-like HicB family nuclease